MLFLGAAKQNIPAKKCSYNSVVKQSVVPLRNALKRWGTTVINKALNRGAYAPFNHIIWC